ncbi:MAG: ABC transporter permease [Prosthecobacter sp.]|nr:ABC transporter permease [Prosthecobacter sp.]
MKLLLLRLSSDHGMIFVLVLLCAFFSFVTLSEQSVTGEAAISQMVAELQSVGKDGRVVIVVRNRADDLAFAQQLEGAVKTAGLQVVEVIKGEPKDARGALQRLTAAGTKLNAVACNEATARWLVFEDLGMPRPVKPESYRRPTFLKVDNLRNIANQIAIIAIIAIGMTMVIITGGIDLSVGSLLALSAVVATWLIREYAGALDAGPWGMVGACVAALVVTGLVGAFSGMMTTRFDVPPFIVTLAVMLMASGLAYTLAENQSIYQVPESFIWLGRGTGPLGIPIAVIVMLVLYAAAHVLMSQTRIGRYLYAVGGNREAAHISGVPVSRVILFAYVASGVLAGLGGVIMASNLKSGSATYGQMYELYVIAAVVVGGASLSGGKGHMANTLIGAFTIAVIQNGMNLTNVESQKQKIVLGAVILAAVLVDKVRKR